MDQKFGRYNFYTFPMTRKWSWSSKIIIGGRRLREDQRCLFLSFWVWCGRSPVRGSLSWLPPPVALYWHLLVSFLLNTIYFAIFTSISNWERITRSYLSLSISKGNQKSSWNGKYLKVETRLSSDLILSHFNLNLNSFSTLSSVLFVRQCL